MVTGAEEDGRGAVARRPAARGVPAVRPGERAASGSHPRRGPRSIRQSGPGVAAGRLARPPAPGRGRDAGRSPPVGAPELDGDHPTEVNYVELSPAGDRLADHSALRSRAVGLVAELAREPPPLRPHPPRRRPRPAGLRPQPDAVLADLDRELRPARAPLLRRTGDRRLRDRRQLDGRLHLGRGSRRRARSIREAGPGLRRRGQRAPRRRRPAETVARMATGSAPLLLRLQERGMRRPRLRYATFKGLFQHPEHAAPRAAVGGVSQRGRQARIPARRPGADRLRHARPARRRRGADADRLGPKRTASCRPRTRSTTAATCATRGR